MYVYNHKYRHIDMCLRGTKGIPRKGVGTSVNMRVRMCKESRVKHYQTSRCLRPPIFVASLAPSRVNSNSIVSNMTTINIRRYYNASDIIVGLNIIIVLYTINIIIIGLSSLSLSAFSSASCCVVDLTVSFQNFMFVFAA